MLGAYEDVGIVIRGILKNFDWHIVSTLYHNHAETSGKGNSDCFFSLGAIHRKGRIEKHYQKHFDETQKNDFKPILEEVKLHSRSEFCFSPHNPLYWFIHNHHHDHDHPIMHAFIHKIIMAKIYDSPESLIYVLPSIFQL